LYPTCFRRGDIQWNYFADGWPNITFEHMKQLENRHVIFLGSLYDKRNILEQLSMIMVLPRQFVRSLTICFPYFAPATMERVETEGTLATAETTAKIMSACLPTTRHGPAELRVYDIHALPVRFYFQDNIVMRSVSAIPLLMAAVAEGPLQVVTIAFPDQGAAKRFRHLFPSNQRIIVCTKVRDGEKRTITIAEKINIDEKNLYMGHVVIVDDLAQSGNTLHECRLALQKTLKTDVISAYVTHPVFPNDAWKRFLTGGPCEGFYRFWTTNTVPEVANVIHNLGPFRTLDIAPSLANDLKLSLAHI
jgi:phosphoribosylpyrophosphate synthetase